MARRSQPVGELQLAGRSQPAGELQMARRSQPVGELQLAGRSQPVLRFVAPETAPEHSSRQSSMVGTPSRSISFAL